jgi:hypothetical protein
VEFMKGDDGVSDNTNVTITPPPKQFAAIMRLWGCGFYERGL